MGRGENKKSFKTKENKRETWVRHHHLSFLFKIPLSTKFSNDMT